jgi:hypothetical protein
MVTGGSYSVTASLTRTAQWLHECSDLCASPAGRAMTTSIASGRSHEAWKSVLRHVDGNAVGPISFVAPAIVDPARGADDSNLRFTDGNGGWSQR